MSSDALARRYLLGDASEDECQALEEEYFRNPDAADHIARVEEDLIEEYLEGRLIAAEREAFERHYLIAPGHRIRMEAIRRLRRRWIARGMSMRPWFALAAALFVIIIGTAWLFLAQPARKDRTTGGSGGSTAVPVDASREPARQTPAPTPRVFAVSLPPISVRSSDAATVRRVPAGTDVVRLQVQGDSPAILLQPRVSIETVDGHEVWRGPAVTGDRASEGIIARSDVPAGKLPANDYVVRLFGRDASGGEREHARYFLRVRGQ